jgi:Xaa-Pro dipeptidase
MRTLVMGRPSAIAERIIEANLATLDLLYGNVKAGRTAHEVAVATQRGVGRLEGEIFRSGHFGYSVGLGFPPTWTDGPMYIAEGNHRELEPGMTFHTPFSWRIPKQFVIGTSETIAVTEAGCEILTRVPREVPIK